MTGSSVWWIRQGLLVVTSIVALVLTTRAVGAFLSGELVPALLLGTAAVVIVVGGGYAWYRYGSRERMQVIEEQIYGPK